MVTSYTSTSRRSSRTRRRGLGWLITLVVVAVLLTVADFAARAFAESTLATKIEQRGLSAKPNVTIGGFPFLTQAASKDFGHVSISASNVTDGSVTLTSVRASATNVRVSSYAFNSGTIGHVNGSVLIDFASLGSTLAHDVGPLGALLKGAGLDLTAAGPHEVRASINLIVTTGSATWRVGMTGPNELNIRLVSSSGLESSLLSSIQNVNVAIPKLPLGLAINDVRVTHAGVVGTITGRNVAFGS
jgi:LmeA-like phospholipid-binding